MSALPLEGGRVHPVRDGHRVGDPVRAAQTVARFVGDCEHRVGALQDGLVEPVLRSGVEAVIGGDHRHPTARGEEAVEVGLVPVSVEQVDVEVPDVAAQSPHCGGVEAPSARKQFHRHPVRERVVCDLDVAAVRVVEDLERGVHAKAG